MYFSEPQIVFQEVPDEISLALSISGCDLGCKGCHSAQTWGYTHGEKLTEEKIINFINKYKGMFSCFLFYGGEWLEEELIVFFSIIKKHNIKICLYTGLTFDEFKLKNYQLLNYLDFLKVGRWIKERGGLNSLTTNQIFLSVKKDRDNFIFKNLNYKFQ